MSERAKGCLLGQLAGDSLGSLVEFQTQEEIRRHYPDGIKELVDGGTWNTIAGQPTDDSEMALMLARSLIEHKTYNKDAVLTAYRVWLDSNPFDCGTTIASGLLGNLNPTSQANGALMRISPLGIFGANHELRKVAEWAELDASLTHPHLWCRQINVLYTTAIAHAIKTGSKPYPLYCFILKQAKEMDIGSEIMNILKNAEAAPPENYNEQQGWVLLTFHNAIWQMLHASTLEEAVINTVMQGGDTDTNAAVCGALLGAIYGENAIPEQWKIKLQNCKPDASDQSVQQPRPECFWPLNAIELATQLLES